LALIRRLLYHNPKNSELVFPLLGGEFGMICYDD